jgi:DNA-binding NtrC family response regulator
MIRDQLEKLVAELLDKGIPFEDARREFEKLFIARALQRSDGNLGNAAEMVGVHRNTMARKISEYRIKRTA